MSIRASCCRRASRTAAATLSLVRSLHAVTFADPAAYPAALSDLELPTGAPVLLSGAAATRAVESAREGIVRGIVVVPECRAPGLGVRNRHGRLCFPFGRLSGTWTLNDLRYALQNMKDYRDAMTKALDEVEPCPGGT